MNKKSKIRVIKDNQKNDDDSYTFIMDDLGILSTKDSKTSPNSKEKEENGGMIDADNFNKTRKKKKVLTNEDMAKSSKGLKFNKPSQRNHSSIYE